MTRVTFEEYQAAKAEIIGGVEYKEISKLDGETIRKTYATERNGSFFEVDTAGEVEFWSTKHPESRIYDDRPAQTPEPASYGRALQDETRAELAKSGTTNISDFTKFILDRGFEFDTEEDLKAGYDRVWKSRHDILVTEDEFVEEAGKGGRKTFSQWNEEAAREAYKELAALAAAGKMGNSEVLLYASYGWCVRRPEAIVAYQTGRKEWSVNNCDTEISEEAARVAVCEEWGFEASRVRILGTPYYDATDWQFIRFDCAHMTWLWKNGSLYQVYQ